MKMFVLAFLLSAAFAAPNYPAPPFAPPPGHPRLYFTAKDLPRLRANTEKPQNAAAWKAQLDVLQRGTGAGLTAIESHAFDYALRGSRENGRKAIDAMRAYADKLDYTELDYNNAGQTVFTIAAVYDWCHALLTADDRQALHDAALKAAKHLEVGWPPVKQGNVTGHGPEGQIFRDLLGLGVAMYDEYPEIYNLVAGRFFSRMVEPRKFVYPAHMHPQGSHYSNYRGQWEMLATWIFDRMGKPRILGDEQQYLMYWSLYARRPDGHTLRDGDTHINNNPLGSYYTGPARTSFLAANYFNDPYLKAEALREIPNLEPSTRSRGNQGITPAEMLIFNNPDLAGRPSAGLPLTHYFPYPKGAMIARTGWQEGATSPAVVTEMKINEWYFSNHQHLDAGAFQIYYRGALATDAGYYQAALNKVGTGENNGSSGYGSAHHTNYTKRSIAHNVITVLDPDERFETTRGKERPLANDGGQRLVHNWREPQEQAEFLDPANGFHIARILGHGFGPDATEPDYTYLKGDLTKAYSEKVKAYERSFVFLNLKQAAHPAALIVLDHVVAAKAQFRKAWLLHGLEQPVIAGNRTVFKDTRRGYTGKLTVDTLLPEAAAITSIGGPGKEFWVDGVNWNAVTRPTGNNEGGGWRVEVSPKTPAETDLFLHVLQMGDHTPDVAALPVVRIDAATHTGVQIADRVVLLAKSRDRLSAPVAFTVADAGKFRILVGGLKAGPWRVERNGTAHGTVKVLDNDGVAYFEGEAGAYRLLQ